MIKQLKKNFATLGLRKQGEQESTQVSEGEQGEQNTKQEKQNTKQGRLNEIEMKAKQMTQKSLKNLSPNALMQRRKQIRKKMGEVFSGDKNITQLVKLIEKALLLKNQNTTDSKEEAAKLLKEAKIIMEKNPNTVRRAKKFFEWAKELAAEWIHFKAMEFLWENGPEAIENLIQNLLEGLEGGGESKRKKTYRKKSRKKSKRKKYSKHKKSKRRR